MTTPAIVSVLMAEREKLSQAIQLFTPAKRRGRRPANLNPIAAIAEKPSPVLEALSFERTRLSRALDILGVPQGKRRGRPPGSVNKSASGTRGTSHHHRTRGWSKAQRKAAAERMRKRWAEGTIGKRKTKKG